MNSIPPPPIDDAELLRGLQNDDPEAQRHFSESAGRRLRGFFRRWDLQAADIDDLTLECIEKAVQRAGSCSGKLWPWVFTIARNRVADWFRKHPPHEAMGPADLERAAARHAHRANGSSETGAAPPPETLAAWAALADHLEALTPAQREVIALRYETSPPQPYEQVAEQLGITAGTARKREFDALKILLPLLAADERTRAYRRRFSDNPTTTTQTTSKT